MLSFTVWNGVGRYLVHKACIRVALQTGDAGRPNSRARRKFELALQLVPLSSDTRSHLVQTRARTKYAVHMVLEHCRLPFVVMLARLNLPQGPGNYSSLDNPLQRILLTI